MYTTLLTDESLWMMGAGHARGPYIGLYESGGSFAWVTGEPTEYTNWVPGDPNGGGSDDVGSFYTSSPATSRLAPSAAPPSTALTGRCRRA